MPVEGEKSGIAGENLPEKQVTAQLERLKTERVCERIWKHDHTLWDKNPGEIENRLGWLHSPAAMAESLQPVYGLTREIQAMGFNNILLLGMGGSSLAPEVFGNIFGAGAGRPGLEVLDSTDPGAVLEKEKKLKSRETLYIVSTKSGGTVETLSLMKYFFRRVSMAEGPGQAGQRFVAITDPGSSLEKTAVELGFRKIFLNDPNIGGRYSALSYFGLVPAGLIGLDLSGLLQRAEAEAASTREPSFPPTGGNIAAWLGVVLGVCGLAGQDKISLVSSPSIRPFEAWIEQLLAESTGKKGLGLLPVTGEPLAGLDSYSADRLFVYLRLDGEATHDRAVARLAGDGHPVVRINLENIEEIGREFFRWMMATAVAGWVMSINPFDQPDVEASKVKARKLASAYEERGDLPLSPPDLSTADLEVYGGGPAENLGRAWQNFLSGAFAGEAGGGKRGYLAIQAYLEPGPGTDRSLQLLRSRLQDSLRMAVTSGYGPRYLHSTGQLHKGDAGRGLFIQLTADSPEDLPIPDQAKGDRSAISFGVLKNAQAEGDRQALLEGGRKVIRFHLKGHPELAIEKLAAALTGGSSR